MAELKRRIRNLLIAIDQLLYVFITLGHGAPDETLSSAAWRLEQRGRLIGKIARPMIDMLFRSIEKDHCRLSYEAELRRTQLPEEMRG